MTTPDISGLPLPQRLALAHAPREARSSAAAAFAFDARLARFVAQATEPMVAQLRLAWWRDQLALPPSDRAKGDVVLDNLSKHFGMHCADLINMIDGWEHLVVAEDMSPAAIDTFAANRAHLFVALHADNSDAAIRAELVRAGSLWALADFAATQAASDNNELVLQAAQHGLDRPVRLPKSLRHLHILGELARSSLRRGGAPMVSRRRDALRISRVGMFGR